MAKFGYETDILFWHKVQRMYFCTCGGYT